MNNINLPDHWKVARLGDVCNIVMGQSPPSTTYNDEGVGMPFLQGKAEFTELFPLPTKYCTKQLRVCSTESVLMSVRAPVGNVNLADREYIIGRGLTSISLKHGNNRFLFYLLLHNKKEFEAKSSGSTFKSINKTTINDFRISLPPLPEQRAIAHILQTIQEVKFTRQREIALERERKAALMDHLFSHGTKGEPRKQTEIGEIPESWEVVQIGEIGKVITGNTPKTSVPEYYGGPYMFITPGDISEPQYVTKTNRYVSVEGLKVLRPLPRDTVIVVCIGATIGKAAMTSAEQSATNQQINAIIPNANAFPHYVYYAITYRSRSLPSLAGRAAVPIVKKSSFAKFLIPFPPLPEQRTIAHVFRAIDKKIAVLQKEVAYLDELFHAMLEELMTGQRSAIPLIENGVVQ